MAVVVVVGGGYAGTAVAKALDEVADVVLVEPRDAFFHNIAALRSVVDPDWLDRVYLPLGKLLTRGRVIRDRAESVDATGVTLASGTRLAADYIVLATGSLYPFPAKTDLVDSAAARAKVAATHDALKRAKDVLILGAGPVGLELTGEITTTWPDKQVTIIDPADDVLAGAYAPEFREELRRQLADLGVDLVLGTRLREAPTTEPATNQRFTVTTETGRELSADIWFRCFGITPQSGYLAEELAAARRADGHLEVTDELRLPGHDTVFAIGDITAIPETKLSFAARQHAEVVATNIQTLIDGGSALTAYKPEPTGIAVPLGPEGGAAYAPTIGLLDSATTSQLKGADLDVDKLTSFLGG
ncbi:FAD-dependent oxidoreductase [Actinophytocola sediminis]